VSNYQEKSLSDQSSSHEPKGLHGPFLSLRNRNYRWLWFGILAFFSGMQMQIIAGGWLVYTMTDSPLALGLVSAGWGVPLLVFSLFGGSLTDRVRKRNLLLVSQSFIFLVSLAITLLIVTHLIALWHLILSSFLLGVIFAFAMPARQAFIVEIVGKEELLNAVALNSVAMNICRIGSPALAGVLLKMIGIPGVYWIIVIHYLVVMVTTMMIPPGGTMAARPHVPMIEDILVGLRYVRDNKTIFTLMVIVFVPIIVAMPFQMLMPVFARSVFGAGEMGLGLLMSSVGIGALLGSTLIASLGNFQHKGLLMLLSGITFGIFLVLFSVSGSLMLALIYLIFVGFGSSIFMTLTSTLLMDNTPEELIGRVMSIFMMTWGLSPLGALPAGALAETFGAPVTVSFGGAILFIFILAIIVSQPRIRRLT
jgi:MFS family permease